MNERFVEQCICQTIRLEWNCKENKYLLETMSDDAGENYTQITQITRFLSPEIIVVICKCIIVQTVS